MHIIWTPYYWFNTKILIIKHIFYFLKSVKGGPLTKIFPTPAIFNGPLCQSQIFIRTLNIFSKLFEVPIIDSAQKFNFKARFLFSKKCKGGTLTKTFPTPANFNRPLHQSQDFIWTLNIFPYYLSSLLLIQYKKLILKHIFYFQKSVKGGPLTKNFCNSCNF